MPENKPITNGSNSRSPPWLWLMALLQGIGPLTIDMSLPAFPEIAREFVMDQSRVELSISFFLLGLSFTQLIFGPLTDRFGRKIPLICGLCIFLVATIVCVIAPNFEILLVARLVQAIGASSGIVIPRATIRDRFILGHMAFHQSILGYSLVLMRWA